MAKNVDLLQSLLDQTIQKYLDMEHVENININKAFEVWVERAGEPKERCEDKNLDISTLQSLARTIATTNGIDYNAETETLSAKLRDGTRVQVNQMPCIASGFTMSLRKKSGKKFDIKDFGLSEEDTNSLKQAVKDHKTIVVSGGTSTGKTTFLECLCREIDINRRLITIEDPPEINFPQPDIVQFAVTQVNRKDREAELSYISIDTLRKTPQSVIFGEIREGILAETFLTLINTGHEGSMTTLHANSPVGAIDSLTNKILHVTDGRGEDSIRRELFNNINIIIQLYRDEKGVRKAYFEEIENVS